jgi:hypothetical protein
VKAASRIFAGLLLAGALLGCDSMELTIAVVEGGSRTLDVANANDSDWVDARLVVEAVESDNSKAICAEKSVGRWKPGETISVPACGTKIRFTLTTGGETARFSYSNGQLFRVFGRKEVPVAQ